MVVHYVLGRDVAAELLDGKAVATGGRGTLQISVVTAGKDALLDYVVCDSEYRIGKDHSAVLSTHEVSCPCLHGPNPQQILEVPAAALVAAPFVAELRDTVPAILYGRRCTGETVLYRRYCTGRMRVGGSHH